MDTTVFRLLDGTKAYLQAVIDNYSRRILAWRINSRLEPAATAALLMKADEASRRRDTCNDRGDDAYGGWRRRELQRSRQ